MSYCFGTARFPTGNCSGRDACVPEGHLKIAQRFSVGLARITCQVPKGRLNRLFAVQPSLRDWRSPTTGYPTLKRWAIINHPSGMKPNQPASVSWKI